MTSEPPSSAATPKRRTWRAALHDIWCAPPPGRILRRFTARVTNWAAKKYSSPPQATRIDYLLYKAQWKRILAHLAVGLAIGFGFAGLDWLLSESYLRLQSREVTYHYLVNRIGAMADNGRPSPVTVVDLGRFAPRPDQNTNTVATNLKGLAALVGEILKAEPAAIAIDVDVFARPTESGQRFPDGFAELIRTALGAHHRDGTPIPVAIAVARNADQPRRAWLGNEEFARLAAGVAAEIPVFALPFALRSGVAKEPMPGLAAMVAGHGVVDAARPLPAAEWLGRNPDPAPDSPVIDQYLVNYVRLLAFQQAAIPAGPDGGFNHTLYTERLQGKVVLLGDVTHATDLVRVPGQVEAVPGVLVHACGVDTLRRAPLFEVGPRVGSVIAWLSSLLGLAVFLTFTFAAYARDVRAGRIRDWTSDVPRTRVRGIALSMILGLGGMFFTLLIAIVLALLGYIWLDLWLGFILSGAQMLVETARSEIPFRKPTEVAAQYLESPKP